MGSCCGSSKAVEIATNTDNRPTVRTSDCGTGTERDESEEEDQTTTDNNNSASSLNKNDRSVGTSPVHSLKSVTLVNEEEEKEEADKRRKKKRASGASHSNNSDANGKKKTKWQKPKLTKDAKSNGDVVWMYKVGQQSTPESGPHGPHSQQGHDAYAKPGYARNTVGYPGYHGTHDNEGDAHHRYPGNLYNGSPGTTSMDTTGRYSGVPTSGGNPFRSGNYNTQGQPGDGSYGETPRSGGETFRGGNYHTQAQPLLPKRHQSDVRNTGTGYGSHNTTGDLSRTNTGASWRSGPSRSSNDLINAGINRARNSNNARPTIGYVQPNRRVGNTTQEQSSLDKPSYLDKKSTPRSNREPLMPSPVTPGGDPDLGGDFMVVGQGLRSKDQLGETGQFAPIAGEETTNGAKRRKPPNQSSVRGSAGSHLNSMKRKEPRHPDAGAAFFVPLEHGSSTRDAHIRKKWDSVNTPGTSTWQPRGAAGGGPQGQVDLHSDFTSNRNNTFTKDENETGSADHTDGPTNEDLSDLALAVSSHIVETRTCGMMTEEDFEVILAAYREEIERLQQQLGEQWQRQGRDTKDSGNQYACDFDGDDSYLSEMTQTDLKEKHDMEIQTFERDFVETLTKRQDRLTEEDINRLLAEYVKTSEGIRQMQRREKQIMDRKLAEKIEQRKKRRQASAMSREDTGVSESMNQVSQESVPDGHPPINPSGDLRTGQEFMSISNPQRGVDSEQDSTSISNPVGGVERQSLGSMMEAGAAGGHDAEAPGASAKGSTFISSPHRSPDLAEREHRGKTEPKELDLKATLEEEIWKHGTQDPEDLKALLTVFREEQQRLMSTPEPDAEQSKEQLRHKLQRQTTFSQQSRPGTARAEEQLSRSREDEENGPSQGGHSVLVGEELSSDDDEDVAGPLPNGASQSSEAACDAIDWDEIEKETRLLDNKFVQTIGTSVEELDEADLARLLNEHMDNTRRLITKQDNSHSRQNQVLQEKLQQRRLKGSAEQELKELEEECSSELRACKDVSGDELARILEELRSKRAAIIKKQQSEKSILDKKLKEKMKDRIRKRKEECEDNDIDQPNSPIDGVAVGVQAGLTSPRSLASEKVVEVLDESFAKEICERQSRNLLTEDDLSKMLDEHFQRVQKIRSTKEASKIYHNHKLREKMEERARKRLQARRESTSELLNATSRPSSSMSQKSNLHI